MAFYLQTGSAGNDEATSFSTADAGRSNWHVLQPLPDLRLAVSEPSRHWRIDLGARSVHVVLNGFIRSPVRLDAGTYPVYPGEEIRRLVEYLDNGGRRISGHFILCLIDTAGGSVSISRDRLGARVAYYRLEHAGGIHVSTAARLVAPKNWMPDPSFIVTRLALRMPNAPGRTAFRDVAEILPGETLVATNKALRSSRPSFEFSSREIDSAGLDPVGEFRDRLGRAVDATMGDHRHVAVMLSGGLDSVPMLAAAARIAREAGTRVTPVSWALPGHPECDETGWIRLASRYCGVEPIVFNGHEHLPFARLSTNDASADSPTFNGFQPLVNECYRRASSIGCRVVLNGNQGDTLYPPNSMTLVDALYRADAVGLVRELTWLSRKYGITALRRDPAVRYLASTILRRRRGSPNAPEWLLPAAVELLEPPGHWPPEAENHRHPRYASQLLGTPMSLGPAQAQEFACRFGVDRREPFQDESLVRFMLEAPFSWANRCGETKRVMRLAMRGMIPEELRLKGRTGILSPFMYAGWRQHRRIVREIVLDHRGDWRHYLDAEYLNNALNSHEPVERQLILVCQVLGLVLWLARCREPTERS